MLACDSDGPVSRAHETATVCSQYTRCSGFAPDPWKIEKAIKWGLNENPSCCNRVDKGSNFFSDFHLCGKSAAPSYIPLFLLVWRHDFPQVGGMAGNSISGPTNSATIRAGGHPVVPDTSLSQPTWNFKLDLTDLPVISEWSCTSNILSIPGEQTNFFCPSYDHNVPMHLNKYINPLQVCHVPGLTLSSFSEFVHLKKYVTSFYGGRYRRMQTDENELHKWDWLRKHCDMTVNEWARPWITGVVGALWDILALARWQIHKFIFKYYILKKWITNAIWYGCWHEWTNSMTFSLMNWTGNTLCCCHKLTVVG